MTGGGVKRKAAAQGKPFYVGLVEKKVSNDYHIICEAVEKKHGSDPIITPESKAQNISVGHWVAFMLGNEKVNGKPLAIEVEPTDPPGGEAAEEEEAEEVVEEPLEEVAEEPATKKAKVAPSESGTKADEPAAKKAPAKAEEPAPKKAQVASKAVPKGAGNMPAFQRVFLPETWESSGQLAADEMRVSLEVKVEDSKEGAATPGPIEVFEELDIVPEGVMQAFGEMGITAPMPIQAQVLPLALQGRNVIGVAKTGSGKTIAFLLPAIVHLQAQEAVAQGQMTPITLILAPTRELAIQISEEATKLTAHLEGVRSAVMYGGGDKWHQLDRLRQGCAILTATPGRLCDVLQSGDGVSLKRVTYFVLDEADRMLEFGFEDQVMDICRQVRKDKQILFFSATWPLAVQALAAALCNEEPVRIVVGQNNDNKVSTREDITQEVIIFEDPDWEKRDTQKQAVLYEHLREVLQTPEHKVLVFVSQKNLADALRDNLSNEGFLTESMHGGKSQEARLNALNRFKNNEVKLLVATDVMGRGLDIPDISHCVIYDMGDVEDYVHRIGRTARGPYGKGHALAFFEYSNRFPDIAGDLIKVLEDSAQEVPDELRTIAQEVIDGKRESKPMGKKYSAAGSHVATGDPFAKMKKEKDQQGKEWGAANNKKKKQPKWEEEEEEEEMPNMMNMFGMGGMGMMSMPQMAMMRMMGMPVPQMATTTTGKKKKAGGGGGGGGGGGNDTDIGKIPASQKVWIGGLPPGCTWKDLQTHFDKVGKTKWVEMMGKHKGVVAYRNEEDVVKAIATLNGSVINGYQIEVDVWG
eukprot:gnl/MRDRNA2_/MRDRNA2_96137_c0_seq1.p1 gnl/MRDRNA2_/MRDRNA2_96137_c0~~gnl/MRDRNA2_/MRDRNA2_96137_c0_seq1.p1  ORF type:complete len:808 (+),score=214.43 gnl/MRDRNA2_/MRDRNA2_96137_c0_seq1:85-2508(+)